MRQIVIPLVCIALLALSGCTGFVAPPGTDTGATDAISFEEEAVERGIDFSSSGRNIGTGYGGVFVTDFDNDGRSDVLAIGGAQPVLYENQGGTFEPSNALPAVDVKNLKSALFFDYDNDGWEDLLLIPRNDTAVFLANEEGTFHRRDVGLSVQITMGTGASAADYDGDGCLDVFVIQNGNWRADFPNRPDPGIAVEDDNGNPNLLFRGDCSAFERVTDAGIEGDHWSLATSFVDLNDDGWADIHVANDYSSDVVYYNRGDGTFERHELGQRTNRHGMASEVEDVDGDGDMDVLVTNIEWSDPSDVWELRNGGKLAHAGNNLLVNQGNGTFEDRATGLGVRVGGWGWAGNLVDLDNDGDLDMIHATKHYLQVGENEGVVHTYPSFFEQVDGRFEQRNASEAGLEPSNGRGLAVLDANADGTPDLLVADVTGKYKLFVTEPSSGNWVAVRVGGTPEQTPLGAKVYVTTEDGTQHRIYNSQSNFLSQDSRTLHFGLGSETSIESLRVVWPDGRERTFDDVPTNRTVVVPYDGELSVGDR